MLLLAYPLCYFITNEITLVVSQANRLDVTVLDVSFFASLSSFQGTNVKIESVTRLSKLPLSKLTTSE